MGSRCVTILLLCSRNDANPHASKFMDIRRSPIHKQQAMEKSLPIPLMNRMYLALAGLALAMIPVVSPAKETIAEILSDPALNLDHPAERAKAVDRIRAVENQQRVRAHAKARAMGKPTRWVLPDGTVSEVVGINENGELIIYTTHNAIAAISSAANLVHPAPYNLDGTGVTVGVWDEGPVRTTHVEF